MWSQSLVPNDFDYFPQKDEKRSAQLVTRVSKSLKKDVGELADFWTKLARAKTGNEAKEITDADVVNRLLKAGIAAAWAEIGGKPDSSEDWPSVISRLLKK